MMTAYTCIHCGQRGVHELLQRRGRTEYDLNTCPACGKLADSYIEHPSTLLLVDLLLAKTSVYRHLLRNKTAFDHEQANAGRKSGNAKALLKLGVTVVLSETYLKWSRGVLKGDAAFLTPAVLVTQLADILLLHTSIYVTGWLLARAREKPAPSPFLLSQALFLSSITRLFLLALGLVWREGLLDLHTVLPAPVKLRRDPEEWLHDGLEIANRGVALSGMSLKQHALASGGVIAQIFGVLRLQSLWKQIPSSV